MNRVLARRNAEIDAVLVLAAVDLDPVNFEGNTRLGWRRILRQEKSPMIK